MPCKNAPLSSESARRPVPSRHNPSKETQLGKTKKEELKMKEYLKTYLEQAEIGDLQTFANLSMIPLVSTSSLPGDFFGKALTLYSIK